MKLGIYAVEKTIFEGEITEIVVKTTTGEITVLPQHEPLISRIVPGPVRVVTNSGEQIFDIGSGYLEVKPGSEVVILVDTLA